MATMHDLIDRMKKKAKEKKRTIIVAEGWDERCLKSSASILANGYANLILLGDEKKIKDEAKKFKADITKATLINPKTYKDTPKLAKELYELRKAKGLTEDEAKKLIIDVNYFGCMLLHTGKADGLAGSAICSTAELMRPVLQIIKTKKDAALVSETIMMEDTKKKRVMFLTDCSLNPDPDEEQLAQIGVNGAECAASFGFEPRVAFLSYSTKGSGGTSPTIEKTLKAVELARKKNKEYVFDGEFQGDAAINPYAASRKCPNALIKGDANVLVFPNLTVANIVCHLLMQLSESKLGMGMLMGIRKPVIILGRSTPLETVENLIINCAMKANVE